MAILSAATRSAPRPNSSRDGRRNWPAHSRHRTKVLPYSMPTASLLATFGTDCGRVLGKGIVGDAVVPGCSLSPLLKQAPSAASYRKGVGRGPTSTTVHSIISFHSSVSVPLHRGDTGLDLPDQLGLPGYARLLEYLPQIGASGLVRYTQMLRRLSQCQALGYENCERGFAA